MEPRDLARRAALLLLLAGCGDDDGDPVASAPAEAAPPAAAATALDPQDGLAGTWYVFMPDLPWLGLRLAVLPAAEGHHVSWISFDWSASDTPDDLAGRSKAVEVTMTGDVTGAVLDGPSPMIAENGHPNGQRGTWHLELHPALDGPARFVGRARHTELTAGQSVPVEMTRDFHAWQRP